MYNLQSESDRFTEYNGQNRVQMPLLLASGRVPLSTAGIMKRRLEVCSPEFGKEYRSTSREACIAQVADAWWTNYCDSGDGALYHPDGKIKVVTDASFLRELKPKTKLVDGAVLIAESDEEAREKYSQIDAPEFTREQIQKDRFGTICLALAREDNSLLGEYRKAVAEELKTRHNYEGENMGVYLRDAPKVVSGRLWCVRSSGSSSDISGNVSLGSYDSRLFGVAPEAQSPLVELKERVPEVNLVVPSNGPTLDQILDAGELALQNWNPRTTPLTRDYLRTFFESLYKPKQ